MAVVSLDFYSNTLHREVPCRLVLPFDRGGSKPYNLLVLLHGLQCDVNSWIYNTRISRFAAERNFAVVMPAGDNSWWKQVGPEGGPIGDYGHYVSHELVDTVRNLLPVAADRAHTFIGGFSMGGYGALRLGLMNPNRFSRILLFAPAVHFFEETPEALAQNGQVAGELSLFEPLEAHRNTDLNPRWLAHSLAEKPSTPKPQIWMRVGTGDWLAHSDSLIADALVQDGFSVDYAQVDGIHSWNFVQDNLVEALDWLSPDSLANLADDRH